MKRMYFLCLAIIIANVATAQTIKGTNFSILKSDGTINGDETYFQRFDAVNDRTELRLNLGDENSSDFKIGYHYHLDGLWYTNFSLDGYGNGFFNGNLGIGTTTPISKLHIVNGDNSYGAILAQANESNFQLYTKTLYTQPAIAESFRLGLKYANDENNGFISFYRGGSTYGGFLGFSTNGIERVRISETGNFGIGTTTPDYKLDVLGTIRANEVKVATGWSDFVFEPDYDLPTLNEVETFIDLNGHLPDIPSAAEVEENGISLGEMDAKLLQKIEELTLYVIELKKENSEMKKEIIELKHKHSDE